MTISYGSNTYHDGAPIIHNYQENPPAVITVGAYCSIAAQVEFLPGGMHLTHTVSTFPWQRIGREGHPATIRGDITIGHDVWIGRGARILGGARIGNGAIIGAYAVVAGTVPDYHVAVGNPARHRPRPHAQYAHILNRIAWWDWPADDPRLPDVERMTLEQFCRIYG